MLRERKRKESIFCALFSLNFMAVNLENQKNQFSLKIALHAAFFVVGIVTVLLGQVLPVLIARLKLNDAEAGFFFTAQFGGSIVGTILTALLIKRLGSTHTLVVAFALFAVGIGGLNFADLWLVRAAVFVYGIGIGLAIPATLLLTARLNPLKTTAALNLMSFVWGTGAIVSQPFVSFAGRGGLILPSVLLIAASVFFAALLATISLKKAKQDLPTAPDGEPDQKPTSLWKSRTALLLVAFGFFDVGIESGISGWLTAYTLRSDLPPEISWLSATPLFFFFFVGGRGLAALLAQRFSNNQIIWASLILTLFGTILLLTATGWQTIFVGAAVLGLGLAAVFPTNMARLTGVLGADAGSKAVPLFVMGSFGSITITWLIGYFSNLYNNDLRAGLAVLLGAAIALLILQIVLHYQLRRVAERRTEQA